MRLELESASRRRRRWRPIGVSDALASTTAARRPRRSRSPVPFLAAAALLLVLAGGYVVFALVRSLPAPRLTAVRRVDRFPGAAPRLVWPHAGEAAVTVEGVGTLGTYGTQRPTPIASVAKIMTAYVLLSDHPLAPGDQGPVIVVTQADAALERHDAALGQSVLPVRAGERLTERQALEGLLIPSGNNIATTLARWDAGSERAFVKRMNAAARTFGLTQTRYTGASGLGAGTVSTAADQVRLAALVFRIPVFRQIVGMPQTILPDAGRQFNVDALIGRAGIDGIKTGSTSAAGGCFVFATRERVGGRTLTVIGAVLHQMPTRSEPSLLGAAFHVTLPLVLSARRALRATSVVPRGATLATITAPWSSAVPLLAGRPARFVGWGGLGVRTVIHTSRRLPAQIRAGQVLGTVKVTVGRRQTVVPLVAARSLGGPSLGWRLRHP